MSFFSVVPGSNYALSPPPPSPSNKGREEEQGDLPIKVCRDDSAVRRGASSGKGLGRGEGSHREDGNDSGCGVHLEKMKAELEVNEWYFLSIPG